MAALQHTEDLHILRLNAMCRVCGRRSKTAKDKNSLRLCRNVASELYQFFEIKVSEEANGTAYSNTLCVPCNCRLNRLKNSKIPSEDHVKTVADQIRKTEKLWIQFNPKVELSDCSVCNTFAEQAKPGWHAKAQKRRRESGEQNIPGNSSDVCDSSVSSDSFNPQTSSTPKKLKVRKRLLEYLSSRRDATEDAHSSTHNDTHSLSTTAKSKTRDAPTESDMQPLFHSEKAGSTVSVQTEQTLRPIEQLQAPLTEDEEKYLTKLVKIKLQQSGDDTLECKSGAGKLTLVRISVARTNSSLAASPTKKKRAKQMNRIRKKMSGSSEIDVVAQQGTELKSTKRQKRAQILKKAGCKQLHITAKTAVKMRAKMSISWAKQRKLREMNKKVGVTMDCEKRERDYQESLMCGEIKIEEKFLKATDPRSGREIEKKTPVASVKDLPIKVCFKSVGSI